LERVRKLFSVALNQQRQSRELVVIRCERGAQIARRIGMREATAEAIQSLDEHWDGRGYPVGLRGEEIPLLSRIMNLAQTLEVFWGQGTPEAAMQVAQERSRRWFDPDLVKATQSLSNRGLLFEGLDRPDILPMVVRLEPEQRAMPVGDETLDSICLAFADVVDAKSPFTYRHSNGVADAAVAISRTLGFDEAKVAFMRRAALLHDIGKLAVPNSILEKPGKPTEEEWACIKQHPYYTLQVLQRIPGFDDLSEIAAAHHEKLNGTGYFRGWGADQLNTPARILAIADIYDALAAKRPYRDALPLEKVLSIMQQDVPHALDAECFEALKASLVQSDSASGSLMQLSDQVSR
jgi:putative nucleotidyltransferase with HDIG domain